MDTGLADGAIEDLLDSNSAGDTDKLGHGRVTAGDTVLNKGRGAGLGSLVSPLNAELVLEDDEITLVGTELHLLLESGTQSVKGVATGSNGSIAEETQPLKTGDNALLIGIILEGSLGGDGPDEVRLLVGGSTNNLGKGVLPSKRSVLVGLRGKEVNRGIAQETKVNKNLNELGETLETEGTSDDGLSLRDGVTLLVESRVTVGVGNKSVTGVDKVRLSSAHEVLGRDFLNLAILPVSGGVSQSEQNTSRRPGELVTQWVVRVLGGGETTAVGEEGLDLTTSLVDLVNGLDGVQVVDTRVQTNLVEDNDAGLLGLVLKLKHGRGDVRSGDNVLLLSNGRLDNSGVVSVGDQGNNKIGLGNSGVKSSLVLNIKRNGLGDITSEFLGLGKSTAGNSNLDAVSGSKNINGGLGNKAGT